MILIIGFISLFASIFIAVVNISSIYFEKQKLQSTIDQAVLLGTDYIDQNSYYHSYLLSILNLDESKVKSEVSRYLADFYDSSEINNLRIEVKNNEIFVDILVNHHLPFGFPFKFATINATSRAKLMVD